MEQEQPKKSLLRKIFGEPISETTSQNWPDLARSWMGRQVERPDLEGQVTNIKPMGIFNKWRYPDAYAVTNPLGGISLNRELIESDKQNLDDVLIHEMTHANQGVGGFLRKFYNPSRDENAAINAEAMRKVRREDIPLRGNEINPNIKVPVINQNQGPISKSVQPTQSFEDKIYNTKPVSWNEKMSGMNKLRKYSLD